MSAGKGEAAAEVETFALKKAAVENVSVRAMSGALGYTSSQRSNATEFAFS
jgi:hypothetical protein